MLIKHRGFEPVFDSSVFVAPTAVLVGRLHVGRRSRIMYGAILDSEGSRIEIGECTIICENAVLRATASGDVDHPVLIGDHVFISPHATVLGCTVEPCSKKGSSLLLTLAVVVLRTNYVQAIENTISRCVVSCDEPWQAGREGF